MRRPLIAFANAFSESRFDDEAFAAMREDPEVTRTELVAVFKGFATYARYLDKKDADAVCAPVALPLLVGFGTPAALAELIVLAGHDREALESAFGDSFIGDFADALAACAKSIPEVLPRFAEGKFEGMMSNPFLFDMVVSVSERTEALRPLVRFLLIAGALRLLAENLLPRDGVVSAARRVLSDLQVAALTDLKSGADRRRACFPLSCLVRELAEAMPRELNNELRAVATAGLLLEDLTLAPDAGDSTVANDEAAIRRYRDRHPLGADAEKSLRARMVRSHPNCPPAG